MYPHAYNWTANVRLCNGGSTSPEAERWSTEAAAPMLQTSQPSFEGKTGRSRVFAQFLSPLIRGSFRDEGTQACMHQWYVHEAGVVFYAAVRSSKCRHGAGKKKKEEWWGQQPWGGDKKREKKGEPVRERGGYAEHIQKRRWSGDMPLCFEGRGY